MFQRENGTPRAMEFRHPGPDPRLGGGWDLRCRFADRRWTCDGTSVRPNQAEWAPCRLGSMPTGRWFGRLTRLRFRKTSASHPQQSRQPNRFKYWVNRSFRFAESLVMYRTLPNTGRFGPQARS